MTVKQALMVSSHAYMVETGKIVDRGPMSELRNDPKIGSRISGGWQT